MCVDKTLHRSVESASSVQPRVVGLHITSFHLGMSFELALPAHPTLQVLSIGAYDACQSTIDDALACRWGVTASKMTCTARSELLSLPPDDLDEHIERLNKYLTCLRTLEQNPMQSESKPFAFQWYNIAGALPDVSVETLTLSYWKVHGV